MAAKLGSDDVSFRLGAGEVAAVYLGTHEVWAPAPSDPDFASVSLLLHLDSDFTDSSPQSHVVTAEGDVIVSQAERKFGGGSAYFDGSEDYLTIPADSSLDLGTGDFTIEMWAYLVEQSNARPALIGNALSYPGGDAFAILWDSSYADNGVFVEGPSMNFGSSSIAKDEWHHIALVRQGTSVMLFIDGVQDGGSTSSSQIDLALGGSMVIGRHWDGTDSDYEEYIDEVRVTKGIARYTSNFTPPDAAFPDA